MRWYSAAARPSKYYVGFDKIGHFAWADIGLASACGGIVAYSLAFLNHYVKGEPADSQLTKQSRGVTVLRYASKLGTS